MRGGPLNAVRHYNIIRIFVLKYNCFYIISSRLKKIFFVQFIIIKFSVILAFYFHIPKRNIFWSTSTY
jgi:hypothetical protein